MIKALKKSGLLKNEYLWLIGSISFGGIFAPLLFMLGLVHIDGATASLFLNFEAVLTALIAWLFFKEHTVQRIVIGMILIVMGGLVLSWPTKVVLHEGGLGILFIMGACLCWAIDNNLTRKISASDSLFIAGSKGLVAGIVNTSLAFMVGLSAPFNSIILLVFLCGFLGYGLSLFLFILALRGLGTARTGAYFSTAPFVGAVIAIVFFHEQTSLFFWVASIFMGVGVGLHLTEKHCHAHHHEALSHDHWHVHDAHHQHVHAFAWDNRKGHRHAHQHEAITHTHAHFPDIHHQHRHDLSEH